MATPKERALWLDGYEDAIRHIYATADVEPEILRDFMERANDRVESSIEQNRSYFDGL